MAAPQQNEVSIELPALGHHRACRRRRFAHEIMGTFAQGACMTQVPPTKVYA